MKQMTGSRPVMEATSEFWCINCGEKGIPIVRKHGRTREKGHRKGIYCVNCRMVINHVETRDEEEARVFREDFAAGKYAEEAAQSVAFAKEHNL